MSRRPDRNGWHDAEKEKPPDHVFLLVRYIDSESRSEGYEIAIRARPKGLAGVHWCPRFGVRNGIPTVVLSGVTHWMYLPESPCADGESDAKDS